MRPDAVSAGGATCTATEFANAITSCGYSAQPDSKRTNMLASIQHVSAGQRPGCGLHLLGCRPDETDVRMQSRETCAGLLLTVRSLHDPACCVTSVTP